jgi:hypothetical protein
MMKLPQDAGSGTGQAGLDYRLGQVAGNLELLRPEGA